jgi:hypothetical protein
LNRMDGDDRMLSRKTLSKPSHGRNGRAVTVLDSLSWLVAR